MKHIMLLGALFFCAVATQAQLLKKLKDKVNKTVGKEGEKNSQNGPATGDDNGKVGWCDTLTTVDGVSYTKAYSGSGNVNIVYSESSMGLASDASGYRLILSQYVSGKTQFIVVENGKVIDTDTKVKAEYIGKGMQNQTSGSADNGDEDMKKYIVPDSSKQNIPKTDAKSVKVGKVNDDQIEMALNIMRQTDEYKNKSDAEKKEIEDAVKKGIAMHNSMAGQSISVPATAGGSYAVITGYKLVVKGKNYGKFIMPPSVFVSKDESTVFAVGADDKAAPLMVTQLKKAPLDKTKFSGNSGKMLPSPDGKKAVYVEPKQMSESEIDNMSSNVASGNFKMTYNALRSDGTTFVLTDYSRAAKFQLTGGGAVININEATGEVYADNKKLGQFKLATGDRLNSDAVLVGASPSSIAYYDGSTGSLHYLDGSVRSLGIMYPNVVSQGGKTYMSWFRKCHNDIYIGRFSY